jgi:phosphoribosylanthranilate isomerase
MSKLKIKICGMTEMENITAVLQLEPEYMGFIFFPDSPRSVTALNPEKILINQMDVQKVGVFVNANQNEIRNIKKSYGLDLIQLHGEESPSFCYDLKDEGIRIIKVFNISKNFKFEVTKEYISVCDFFLFDTKTEVRGGSGTKFNWDILNDYEYDHPFFLSGGIQLSDAKKIKQISHPSIYGVDVNSGFEISPGVKDSLKLKEFINEIRNEDT